MVISCFSFTEIAKRAAALMTNGGSMITLTYGGSMRVVPRYNVMGVAKAALEASVKYLAVDLGGIEGGEALLGLPGARGELPGLLHGAEVAVAHVGAHRGAGSVLQTPVVSQSPR